jgi:hypothetical protein
VVQLLHSTRKSGTLAIKGIKGECQLVFDEGFIISANHFDNSLRIGRILVEAKVLSEAGLNEALREQAAAGAGRKPLIATLIESGRVRKEEAFRGLETLLELTIVEVLTWKRGSFTLDVGTVAAADEYRYFPEKLQQGTRFHTENILMEALRIYDEKKRDGTLADTEPTGGSFPPSDVVTGGILSADDLGLADIEKLERRIPGVFKALEDRAGSAHRSALDRLAPDLSAAARERLAVLLESLAPRSRVENGPPIFVVFYSGDELLSYCLGAACRHEKTLVFTTNEGRDIDPVLGQCRAKGGFPALVLDAPSGDDPRLSPETLAGLRCRARRLHRHLCTIQFAGQGDPLPLDGSSVDVVAVLALPRPDRRSATFVEDLAAFLTAFPAALEEHAHDQRGWAVASVENGLKALRGVREAPAVPRVLLRSVAGTYERALTLFVRGSELLAERGIGFSADAGREPQPLAGPALRIPVGATGLLSEVVNAGRCRSVQAGDPSLAPLLARIGAPHHPEALLLPLQAAGRTVSLTYADFGRGEATSPDLDLLGILAAQAGLALEGILARARAEKAAPRPAPPPTRYEAGA